MTGEADQPAEKSHHMLWRVGYAWTSFEYVRDTCDYIIKHDLQPNDEIYYSLMVAICVLYGRPFTRSRGGIQRLSADIVPRKFAQLHSQIMLVRHQIAAHTDAAGAHLEDMPANNVRLQFDRGQVRLAVSQVKFKRPTIQRIRQLAHNLSKIMLSQINDLLRALPEAIDPEGEYLLDMTTGEFRIIGKHGAAPTA
jgi:hypothetical protein